jgi:hypothetical protein
MVCYKANGVQPRTGVGSHTRYQNVAIVIAGLIQTRARTRMVLLTSRGHGGERARSTANRQTPLAIGALGMANHFFFRASPSPPSLPQVRLLAAWGAPFPVHGEEGGPHPRPHCLDGNGAHALSKKYYIGRARAEPAFTALLRTRTRTTHWWQPPALCVPLQEGQEWGTRRPPTTPRRQSALTAHREDNKKEAPE